MHRSHAIAVAIALLAPPLPTLAEEEIPPELESLQTTFREQHTKLLDAYTARLRTLRKSFERDHKLYEAALTFEAIQAAEASRPSTKPPVPESKTYPVGDIHILSVTWGLAHRRDDITERVATALADGVPFEINRDNLGDPFPYKAKDLVLVYIHDSRVHTFATEGKTVLTLDRITEARNKKPAK